MPNIEIVYGLSNQQALYRMSVPDGTTARQAALQSPVLQAFPDADPQAPLGIFGKVVKDDTILQEGDRVEWYRPLIADPKEARRQRVKNKANKS